MRDRFSLVLYFLINAANVANFIEEKKNKKEKEKPKTKTKNGGTNQTHENRNQHWDKVQIKAAKI